VAIAGVPYLLTDTAGLREGADAVERIGVARAQQAIDAADILLWLGDPADCPAAPAAIRLHAKADVAADGALGTELAVSAVTGQGMDALRDVLAARAAALLPREGDLALNVRQREALTECAVALRDTPVDLTLFAESLRAGCRALDRVTGRAGVEDMLDALFSRLCIGK
jgi:tRNA modification GTPase